MKQQGLVMVFSLLVLLSLTILGVSSVTSGLFQSKMASSLENRTIAFDAAEAAVSGVVFESEDPAVLTDPALTDPLSEARQQNAIDLANQDLSCFDNINWTDRSMTQAGLTSGVRQVVAGAYNTNPSTASWSKTAFVREQACLGSSNVISGSSINCHVFLVRGCGQLANAGYAVANTLTTSVFAPASGN
ncbi:PilX N-terminal domain-containing pilus assembly protein [Alteromonas sp. a30]|uniref:PilX N-terminal domain-containing pilus assembly protein n=1 Tax=Alteromonas sp. a30 TaxID=2730917 RepID=UPI0022828372|nr:PilX N-terminal domain-containing pilus assembly protein [Alteromonas sp. a30]MCY7295934.1 pilus assembly protein PilZ [Alteromonas sp. a30]